MIHARLGRRIMIVVLAGVLAACSSSVTDESLSDEAAKVLQQHMAAVRAAVEAEDAAAADEALDALRREAQSQADAGEITEQRLTAIEQATVNASEFVDELAGEPAPEPEPEPEPEPDPTPTPTPMSTPTPATSTAEASSDGGEDADEAEGESTDGG